MQLEGSLCEFRAELGSHGAAPLCWRDTTCAHASTGDCRCAPHGVTGAAPSPILRALPTGEHPMPSSNPLSSLFGRSPIGPIQEHMQVANDAAQLLPAFLEAAQDDDWKLAEEIFKRIGEAEEAADKLKRSVRRHLPNSLFLPVPRTDL
ncbi:MAG TPA: hypothetical protein DD808_14255, partial [Halieaceae bacterium]|nr:hypothetical protein [Halieaceae bacterium]